MRENNNLTQFPIDLESPCNIQGREPYLCDFVKKEKRRKSNNFVVGSYADIIGPISFQLGMMI